MYRWYQILLTILKIDMFFFLGYSIQYLVLVLQSGDVEFPLTIIALPLTCLFLVLAVYAVSWPIISLLMIIWHTWCRFDMNPSRLCWYFLSAQLQVVHTLFTRLCASLIQHRQKSTGISRTFWLSLQVYHWHYWCWPLPTLVFAGLISRRVSRHIYYVTGVQPHSLIMQVTECFPWIERTLQEPLFTAPYHLFIITAIPCFPPYHPIIYYTHTLSFTCIFPPNLVLLA